MIQSGSNFRMSLDFDANIVSRIGALPDANDAVRARSARECEELVRGQGDPERSFADARIAVSNLPFATVDDFDVVRDGPIFVRLRVVSEVSLMREHAKTTYVHRRVATAEPENMEGFVADFIRENVHEEDQKSEGAEQVAERVNPNTATIVIAPPAVSARTRQQGRTSVRGFLVSMKIVFVTHPEAGAVVVHDATQTSKTTRLLYGHEGARVGRRDEWAMTASTVNAYYNPPGNEIVFPAGIMQFPMFGDLPSYVTYGAFGAVAGHELSHAFDNNGRRYDENGKYEDWWSNNTVKGFTDRAQCFIE